MLLFIPFILLYSIPSYAQPAQAVDSDSNIDLVDNIGIADSTYLNAQTQNAVYQNINENDTATGPIFTENWQSKTVSTANTWENWDLSSYGVGDGDIVEINIWVGDNGAGPSTVGCRTDGTSIERKVTLGLGSYGRANHIKMTCKASSSGIIEVIANYTVYDGTIFYFMGMYDSGDYTQIAPTIYHPAGSGAFEDATISEIDASSITEIYCANTDNTAENNLGVRSNGASLNRYFDVRESSSSGYYSGITLIVESDSSKVVEIYAEDHTEASFVVLGYWNTAPGSFTEKAYAIPANAGTNWEDEDLSAQVTNNSIAEMVVGNSRTNQGEYVGGWRANGSSLDRNTLLDEADGGGECFDTGMCQVGSDGIIELRVGSTSYISHWVAGYWDKIASNYEIQWEHQCQSVPTEMTSYRVAVYGYTDPSENVEIQMWNGGSWDSPLSTVISTSLQWYNNTISSSYIISGSVTWRYRGVIETGDTTQTTLKIDQVGIWYVVPPYVDFEIVDDGNNTRDGNWDSEPFRYSTSLVPGGQDILSTDWFYGSGNTTYIFNFTQTWGDLSGQTKGQWLYGGSNTSLETIDCANGAWRMYIYYTQNVNDKVTGYESGVASDQYGNISFTGLQANADYWFKIEIDVGESVLLDDATPNNWRGDITRYAEGV